MQRCVECGGSAATCDTWPGSEDGIGILGADIVIYVGATIFGGFCSSNIIAFASSCHQKIPLTGTNYNVNNQTTIIMILYSMWISYNAYRSYRNLGLYTSSIA